MAKKHKIRSLLQIKEIYFKTRIFAAHQIGKDFYK